MSRAKILVVEDNFAFRRFVVRLLQREGFEVLETDNPAQALTFIRTQEPALALVDIHLSSTSNGFDLCRRIKEWMKTEVILMSGIFISAEDRIHAYAEGAVNFIEKSDQPGSIIDGVRHFFQEPKPLLRCAKGSGNVKVQTVQGLGNVLIIEDDEQMLDAVSLHLEGAGFVPFAAETGQRGIVLAFTLKPSAILLDVGLPDISGNEVLRILKTSPRTKDIPVLMWTGTKKRGQETALLDRGAAHYLIKGFNEVEAIPQYVKRALGIQEPAGLLEKGPIRIDLEARSVWVGCEPVVGLSPKEFDLLAYLVGKSPAVVKWSEILSNVWAKYPAAASEKCPHETVEVHARTLRLKLGKACNCIVTHKGVGLQYDSGRFQRKPVK